MFLRSTLCAISFAILASPLLAQEIPVDQQKFSDAIGTSRTTYDEAPNDLVKSSERKSRAKAICEIVDKGKIKDWVGTVYDLTTNGDGNGVLSIELAGEIWVSTFNNAFSDISSETLVPADSDLFKNLMVLAKGQSVTFSGEFFKSAKKYQDCLQEQSLTEAGSMSEPEFLFRFSDVKPVE